MKLEVNPVTIGALCAALIGVIGLASFTPQAVEHFTWPVENRERLEKTEKAVDSLEAIMRRQQWMKDYNLCRDRDGTSVECEAEADRLDRDRGK